tara:strand:+ start:3259 stop:4716 length:1458 start_codon:yes stop_codon:yes gene_type:complete
MFKAWCASQKFNNATNLSHVLMDGGVLSVPFDKLNDFYEQYVDAVKRGEKLYVVEQKSERYNFFVDIDYKDENPLEVDEIKSICKVICDKVKRHGGKECLISISPPKESGTLVKTGVHLNWPGFVVDQISALALRDHILLALSTLNSGTDWNEIIDLAVYGNANRKTKGSGFRMPWSYKRAKHNPCGGQGCENCERGRVDQLAYLPIFRYVDGPLSTVLQIDQNPNVEILKMSAVRTDMPQMTHVEPPSIVIKEGTFTNEQTKDEFHDEETKGLIQDYVRKHLEGQANSYITKLFKHRQTFLVSTNSKYCENLKREHGSNHVWFIISGNEIIQKCFCRCETLWGRRDGFCKDFCGRRHLLTPNITDKLYPKKEQLKYCPEIKKRVEKPLIEYGGIKKPLETFITRNMKAPEGTHVVKIEKMGKSKPYFIALTTSNYCETIRGVHDDISMSYIIRGKEITQKCPKCKRSAPRVHVLNADIVKVLKQ